MPLNYYLYNKYRKVIDYEDDYKDGFRYFYDNNKILVESSSKLEIIDNPCLIITSGFIWENINDFSNIISIGGYNFVIPQFGNYIIVNAKTNKMVGLVHEKHVSPQGGPYDYHYINARIRMYDKDHKLEKYTGGMLDGYLYRCKDPFSGTITIIKHANTGTVNDYLFDHKLNIYEVPYITEPAKIVNDTEISLKNVRVGYSDSLLFKTQEDGRFSFERTFPKNSISYEHGYWNETTVVIKSNYQTTIEWDNNSCEIGKHVFEIYVNNKLLPKDNYNLLELRDSTNKLIGNAIQYLNSAMKPLKENDVMTIRTRSQYKINQYNMYDITKEE